MAHQKHNSTEDVWWKMTRVSAGKLSPLPDRTFLPPHDTHILTVTGVLRQATWEEDWNDRHPGIENVSNHDRKVIALASSLNYGERKS